MVLVLAIPQENRGGTKKYQTNSKQIIVAMSPPFRPETRALKNTAGKNRNQTNGSIHVHSNNCTLRAMTGNIIAKKNCVLIEYCIFSPLFYLIENHTL
jgi:hypothetical protein